MTKLLFFAVALFISTLTPPIAAQSFSAQQVPPRKYDSYNAVKAQGEEAGKTVSSYEETKRGCRLIADGLERAVQLNASIEVLKRAQAQLQKCYLEAQNLRKLLEPFMLNIYMIVENQESLVQDGWTPEQIAAAFELINRWDNVYDRIKKVDRSTITDNRIESVIEKAERKISPKLEASSHRRWLLFIATNFF